MKPDERSTPIPPPKSIEIVTPKNRLALTENTTVLIDGEPLSDCFSVDISVPAGGQVELTIKQCLRSECGKGFKVIGEGDDRRIATRTLTYFCPVTITTGEAIESWETVN